jgi:tetratricopeptide (TPR) repeat protein
MSFRVLIALLAALAAFSVLAQAQVPEPDDDDDEAPPSAAAVEPQAAETLPLQDLTEPMLYQLLLGEIAAQRDNPALAAQTFLELAKRTRDPRVARRAVEIANYARAPNLALEAARLWHDADPQSVQGLRMLTVLLVNARRVEEAEPYIAKLLAGEGDAATGGLMQLGQLLAQNPDKAANLSVVQRVAQRYPRLPEARFAVAQAAVAANDETLALGELRRAAELRPDWEQAALYEAELLRRKSPEEAVKRLAGFLERFPNARDARLGFARLLVGEKRYPEARAQFQALLAIHKNDTEAIYGVGLLALQAKEYAIAEANLRRLLELGYRDPNGVRFTLGQLAEEQKDWSRAIEWYQTIQRGEQALPARLRIANVLAKQGRLEEARAFLRSASSSGEQQVQLVIAEAQLLREANRHREAFDLLGGALEKNPDQPDLLYDHALTAEKLERVDVLESNLRKLIQARPDHAHAYNALGYSLAERNERLAEARKLIERALQIAPDDHFIIDSMGWVLYRIGDLKGAADYLRRAWRSRQDGDIGAHLGEVLWVMGERAEAERIWNEAAEASPENETLQNTIKRLKK